MADDGSDGARALVNVSRRNGDCEHGVLGADQRRIERERKDDGRHATNHLIPPAVVRSNTVARRLRRERLRRQYAERHARIRFVTDDFDGAGPRNAPKFAQIALRRKREQKAFRPGPGPSGGVPGSAGIPTAVSANPRGREEVITKARGRGLHFIALWRRVK